MSLPLLSPLRFRRRKRTREPSPGVLATMCEAHRRVRAARDQDGLGAWGLGDPLPTAIPGWCYVVATAVLTTACLALIIFITVILWRG